jgi:hypothetical protein
MSLWARFEDLVLDRMSPSKRRPFMRFGAAARRLHRRFTWWRHSPANGSGITIRIRYRILNARLVAGAVSGGGVDQAYDGWREVSEFEFQQWGGKRSFAGADDPLGPELGSITSRR